jgi:predicted transposase YdaD
MLAETVASWPERYRQEGILLGRQEGLQEGRQKGRQEGRQEGLQGQRATLLDMLADRFGAVSMPLQSDINSVAEMDVLRKLIRSVYKVATLSEFCQLLPPKKQ